MHKVDIGLPRNRATCMTPQISGQHSVSGGLSQQWRAQSRVAHGRHALDTKERLDARVVPVIRKKHVILVFVRTHDGAVPRVVRSVQRKQ